MYRRSVFALVVIVLILAASVSFVPAGRVQADSTRPPSTPIQPDRVSISAGTGSEQPVPAVPLEAILEPVDPSDFQALGSFYGYNLLGNGIAEYDAPGPASGWTVSPAGSFQIGRYGSPGLPLSTDPGPADRGTQLFYTSAPACGTIIVASKLIDVTAIASVVDSGMVPFQLSGWFGGPGDTDDQGTLNVYFRDAGGNTISSPVFAAGGFDETELKGRQGMLFDFTTGLVPPGTRKIQVALIAYDPHLAACPPVVFADNLWFSLHKPTAFIPFVNRAGSSAPTKTVPAAPTSLLVVNSGYLGNQLTWTDNAGNETGYKVERRVEGKPQLELLAFVDANATTYLDKDFSFNNYRFAFNQQYTYQVTAVNDAGSSAPVQYVYTSPAPPTTIPEYPQGCWVSNLTPDSVVFSWLDSSNNEEFFPIWIFQEEVSGWRPLANVEPDATNVTIVNLLPGVKTTLSVSAQNTKGVSADACRITFTPPGGTDGTFMRFINDASYPIAYLEVDGIEEFPVYPMGILPGSYYEMELAPGAHTATVSISWWDSRTTRFFMYTYSYEFTINGSGVWELSIADPDITSIMTQFNDSGQGYWEGYYFDANSNCRTAAFLFKDDGSYKFYVSNSETGHGTYSQTGRDPNLFTIDINAGGQAGLLVEPYGYFDMNNGPASWKQITYSYKPTGYIYNPFCP